MPRLVGKSSNKGLVYSGVFLLLAIATGGTLEYMGVIDLIPGFGQSTKPENPPQAISKDRQSLQ
jgi:hypothetical protein